MKKRQRIVVICLMTYGDFILIIPFLKALRAQQPKARIAVLCGRRGDALCRLYPWVDEIINLGALKTLKGMFGTLSQITGYFRSDRVYSLFPFFAAAFISLLLGGRQRIGFYQVCSSLYVGPPGFLLRCNVPRWKSWMIRHLFLTKAVEMIIDDRHASTRFSQSLDDPNSSGETLRGSLLSVYPKPGPKGQPRIILAPFTGWQPKNWPLERWVLLAAQFSAAIPSCEIFVCCEPSSRSIAEEAFSNLAQTQIFSPGQDFESLFKTFAAASLVVANDSFLLHVATALNIATVGLFGPTLPKWFGALGEGSVNLFQSIECNPCLQSRGTQPCLQNLQTCAALSALPVEQVLDACVDALKATKGISRIQI